MTKELKPCPFCGGEAEIFKMTSESDKEFECWYVICEECTIQTPACITRDEASEAWNRRTPKNTEEAR